MEKYQQLFMKRLQSTIQRWVQQQHVTNQDLYRFVHTVKGTAASIGLPHVSELAEESVRNLNEADDRIWEYQDWYMIVDPILQTLDFQQSLLLNNRPLKNKQPPTAREDSPLILVVDDDIEFLTYLKDELEKEGLMVLGSLNAEKALEQFYEQKPDCVILDVHLPDKSGLDVLHSMIEKAQALFIPILVISADHDKNKRMQAYEIGAVDYIEKPFDYDEFKVRLKNRLKYKEIANKAILLDELTGAFNRKFFKLEMERQLHEISRSNESFAIVLLDLDYFKSINDRFGHHVGDEVLLAFSNFIKEKKRFSDFFIRYGGEEFILLLPRTNSKQAHVLTNRLLQEFSAVTFGGNENSFHVTFSAGIVEITSESAHIEEYMKRVDQALYRAKEDGRNRVCIYDKNAVSARGADIIHIGIIDDDTVMHQLLSDQLTRLQLTGFALDVKAFRDGEEFFGCDWHKQKGKYLILLDGILPRMDGLEVLKKIRNECDKNDFVVIMLTGRKEEKDIVAALEMGADDYLTKPFSLIELEARIKRLVLRMLN
ncbi:diguanylate cyclase [Fodinisporobacter ferrooxydans]|uniref:Diguanylate cyclase n=1 Tax=Fodinisporobacter ferrooxydans TaxID=2901836 RepID=A0ABY4CNH4_9BACL|nr:diguanylate cyclase [Alicyclobacillaceae bacterium MYW30-H2]